MIAIKPEKDVFLLRRILAALLVATFPAVIAGVAGFFFLSPWVPLVVFIAWLLWGGWTVISSLVMYGKEHYEIHEDRILIHRGGVFSDFEVELHFRQVTHVQWIRPWLSYRLFGVGDLRVEAAGGTAGAVSMLGIINSEQVEKQIRDALRQNGFSMDRSELLHDEGPAAAGILLDLLTTSVWGTVVSVFFLAPMLTPLLMEAPWLLLLVPLIIMGFVALLVLRYLDLKRRSYRVYNGLVEYHEGFLTRNDAFIPVENISDSEVTRGIPERITNCYKIIVSCQGAGQEIKFLYLRKGRELSDLLDRISRTASSPGAELEEGGPSQATSAGQERPTEASSTPSRVQSNDSGDPARTYRMHPARTLVPLLLYIPLIPLLLFVFPLLLILLFNVATRVARVWKTVYSLHSNSVEETFEFVVSRSREFTKDKITAVHLRKGPFDRLFGTCSIQFWSIGAGQEITFQNIREEEGLLDHILNGAGIHPQSVRDHIQPEFSLPTFLLANGPVWLVLFLAAAGLALLSVWIHPAWILGFLPLLAAPLIAWVRGIFYYPRSRLDLFEDCLQFQRGLLIRETTYARFDNIKDITTLKIPLLDNGLMRFNVAGERLMKSQRGQQAMPYGFTMRYVPQLLAKDEWFDRILLGRDLRGIQGAQEIWSSGKAAGNTLCKTALFHLILFPLLPLLPISLGIALWRVRLVRYILEPDRVLKRRGVLYRSQTSILVDRIDHIQTQQGAFNKLFKNGTILIHTAGSSRAELVLADVPDWEDCNHRLQDLTRDPSSG